MAIQEAFEHMKIVMELIRLFDVYVPKFHIVWHALAETGEKGNPWFYSSWKDESLNKLVKVNCRYASQHCFEEVVLNKTREALKPEPSSASARKRASES